MIKGVFFDVGGTLYSYDGFRPALGLVANRLSEEFGIGPDADAAAAFLQQGMKDADQHHAAQPFYLFKTYFRTIYARLVEHAGRADLAHHDAWFEQQMFNALMSGVSLKPDCHDTLGALKASNLYLSAVSNADDDMLEPLIANSRLEQYFTHWTSSEAARSCKPDRQIFDIALGKSWLAPEEVVFVGDSLEQDIAGAHAAGMTTVLITDSGMGGAPLHVGRETPDPHFTISSLSELPGVLARLR